MSELTSNIAYASCFAAGNIIIVEVHHYNPSLFFLEEIMRVIIQD